MIRDFVAGVLWGGVVAGVGLGVISQVAPLRPAAGGATGAEVQAVTEPPAAVASDVVAPDAAPAKVASGADPAPQGETAKTLEAAAEAAPVLPEPVTPKPEAPQTDAATVAVPAAESGTPVIGAAGETPQVGPTDAAPLADLAPAAPKAVTAENATPVAEAPKTGAPKAEAVAEPAITETEPPAVDPVPAAEAPQPDVVAEAPAAQTENPLDAGTDTPKADLPETGPETAPAAPPVLAETPPETTPPDQPAPGDGLLSPPEVPEVPKPSTIAPDAALPGIAATEEAKEAASTLLPEPGLENATDGVTTGRLPAISADPAPEAEAEATAPAPADLPPLQRFARDFENPGGKPLFALLLIDPGTPELDRAALAALPFPVTFAIDPLSDSAAAAAALYRGAGQEVVTLATGIPAGAKASDLEQTFAAYEQRLPEAVALMDITEGGFQDDRGLASEVVPLVKAQGRGLVTFDRGLNAADQVARREGLPAALVFRSLDQDGEDSPLIRRYLDRAAFKAAQEGKVLVVGTSRPETVAALIEWSVEGRASSVALAPLTAVLSAP